MGVERAYGVLSGSCASDFEIISYAFKQIKERFRANMYIKKLRIFSGGLPTLVNTVINAGLSYCIKYKSMLWMGAV